MSYKTKPSSSGSITAQIHERFASDMDGLAMNTLGRLSFISSVFPVSTFDIPYYAANKAQVLLTEEFFFSDFVSWLKANLSF
jgi:hypothetical protein